MSSLSVSFQADNESVPSSAETRPRSKILVIEDEALIALDIAHDLQSWKYDVIGIARTMDEAVMLAEENAPDFAIVDVTLHAGNDGVEIAEKIKAKFGTKIVFLTANTDQTTRTRIVKLDPAGHLYKPYSAFALRQLIETYET